MRIRLIDSTSFDAANQFQIQLFGVSSDDETVSVLVTDFRPFFFVCVPSSWGQTKSYKYKFKAWFIKQMKSKKGDLDTQIKFVFCTRKKLYGFDGDIVHNFIKVEFPSLGLFYEGKNIFYTGTRDNSILIHKVVPIELDLKEEGFAMTIFESNIPPLLRYFHSSNISPSGWIEIDDFGIDNAASNSVTESDSENSPSISHCKHNFRVSKLNITALPDCEIIAPFKILSFDIECSSSDGSFPLPKKTYKKIVNSILEYISKNAGEVQTKPSMESLFSGAILTAFGFSEYLRNSFDRVYLKTPISEKALLAKIKVLLAFNLATLSLDEGTLALLQEQFLQTGYENIHSKPKKTQAISFSGAAIGTTLKLDDDEDDDEADDDNIPTVCSVEQSEDCGMGSGEVDSSFLATKFSKKQKLCLATADIATVSDLLLCAKTDIDKMTILTTLLDRVLPQICGDEVTFIGSCFLKNGQDPSSTYSHCISVGECDPVLGVEIVCVATEKELLLKWIDLVIEHDPDLVIGYNIFGFDYEFMFRRAQENQIEELFLQLSRRPDEYLKKTRNAQGKLECHLENTKVNLASGEFDLRFPKMTGRLQIDLYTYMRRDYILSSYKLDDVSSAFISDAITNVEHDEENNLTIFSTKNILGLNVGDFIRVEEGGFSTDYYEKGLKMRVTNIQTHTGGVKLFVNGIHNPNRSKRIRWCLSKDDLSPKDLFRMTNEGPSSKAVIAKYCIQDCRLVLNLMNKIDILTGYIEMSAICSVPMSFLVLRGQGIKLTSYMAKKCRTNGILMPDIAKSKGNEAYEGAIVLPPKCKMYLDEPIACVDFASLYPSSMISRNLSHDSKVWTETFDLSGNRLTERTGHFTTEEELDSRGLKYEILTFDTFIYEKRGTSNVKMKSGSMSCCFIQPGVDGKKGILPLILEELLRARQQAKKQAKTETDPFMKNILDKRQLGYKLTANSLYGQCGAKTSTFYDKDIAAATTKTGREMLITARDFIEREYKSPTPIATTSHGFVYTDAKYVYGDSVTAYCPLLLRVDDIEKDQIVLVTAEEATARFGRKLDGLVAWQPYLSTKEICTPEERFCIHTWTDAGWTSVKYFIRHRLHASKAILRITTTHGIIDATDDHSLLRPSGECVRAAHPGDKKSRDRISEKGFLMAVPLSGFRPAADPVIPRLFPTNGEKLAQIHGFLVICGHLNTNLAIPILSISHADRETLAVYQSQMTEISPWKEMDTVLSRNIVMQKYRMMGGISLSEQREAVLGIIPEKYFLPSCSRQTRISFLKGVVDGNGSVGYMHNITVKKQILAAQLFLLCKSFLGMRSTRILSNRRGNWTVHICLLDFDAPLYPSTPVIEAAKIISIETIPYQSGYVYDLTTENHHFGAGIGELIVHNTDSVFFTFNLSEDNGSGGKSLIRGQKALEITIDLAQQAAVACTAFLNADPIELAYEKTLMPFILLAKKRYVGMLYENSADVKDAKLKFMGLSLKRRDTSDFFKDSYGTIIKKLMSRESMEDVLSYLNDCMRKLVLGHIPIEKLIVSKSLKGFYKNPQSIAHKVLADRIASRDPGNAPRPGERVQFVYIVHENPRALLGERVEIPIFIQEKHLQIDYSYYVTNQLMRPLLQLLGSSLLDLIAIKHPVSKVVLIRKHKMQLENIYRSCLKDAGDQTDTGELGPKGIELEAKQREKYSSSIIKDLIFGDILTELNTAKDRMKTKREGNQLITAYFNSNKKPRIGIL